MTLGSLFDGSGGVPLAGVLVGITPVWSSEIEAYPLRVTAARFPNVKQLGDVTKINGAEIDPVDIITFGSPCQDLSVAGKQKGIHDGERSNLFFEAVRIIKEMRNADKANGRSGVDIRPRFAVWENVPGAFSSNKGADFQAVLQALASVSCDEISIPRPKKWNNAGCVVDNGSTRPMDEALAPDAAGLDCERSGALAADKESAEEHLQMIDIDYIHEIRERVPTAALYEQLAEECVELAHEALKMARHMRNENPTPMTEEQIKHNLIEEASDAHLVSRILDIKPDPHIVTAKLARWYDRLMDAEREAKE